MKNLGKEFDAQTAAILGFSIFSTQNYYLLNDNGELNIDILKKFYKKTKIKNFIYLDLHLIFTSFYLLKKLILI